MFWSVFFHRQKKIVAPRKLYWTILSCTRTLIAIVFFLFFDFQTPVCDARRRVRRRFTVDRTAWSSGASATTRSITAACPFGSNRTIVARCASKSGLSNEWESNPQGRISTYTIILSSSSSSRNCAFSIGLGFVSKASEGTW